MHNKNTLSLSLPAKFSELVLAAFDSLNFKDTVAAETCFLRLSVEAVSAIFCLHASVLRDNFRHLVEIDVFADFLSVKRIIEWATKSRCFDVSPITSLDGRQR
jgi:hypothetical protein